DLFLVGGQQFLVGGLQLAVHRLQPLDGGAQVALGDRELVLQLSNAAGGGGVQIVFFHRAVHGGGPVLQKQDGQQRGAVLVLGGDGLDAQVHHLAARGAVHRDAGVGDGLALGAAAADGGGGRQVKVLVEHREEIEGGLAGGQGEI